jgi:hypothetical protein
MQQHWPSDTLVAPVLRPRARAVPSGDWAVRVARAVLAADTEPRPGPAPVASGPPEGLGSHWPEMVAVILRIRGAYLARFPRAQSGCTLGDLERLLTLAVAVPTYQLARQNAAAPGPLHPVLVSLLRIGQALLRAARQLRTAPGVDGNWSAGTRVAAADILPFIERQEGTEAALTYPFLRALTEGPTGTPPYAEPHAPPVQRALDDLDAAFDYALLGLQAGAVVGSLGPLLARTHARVSSILQEWHGERPPALDRLQAWLQQVDALLQEHGLDAAGGGRASLEILHADTYALCAAGLGDPVRQSLAARLAGEPMPRHGAAGDRLRAVLRRSFAPVRESQDDAVEWLLDCLMHAFARMQQVLALVEEIQQRIDALLERPQPHPARGTDLQHILLVQDELARRLPALLSQLEQALDFRAAITASGIEIRSAAAWPMD